MTPNDKSNLTRKRTELNPTDYNKYLSETFGADYRKNPELKEFLLKDDPSYKIKHVEEVPVVSARTTREDDAKRGYLEAVSKAQEAYKKSIHAVTRDFGPQNDADKKSLENSRKEYAALYNDGINYDPRLVGLDGLLGEMNSVPQVVEFLKRYFRYQTKSDATVKPIELPAIPVIA